jgi:hypothetical protein
MRPPRDPLVPLLAPAFVDPTPFDRTAMRSSSNETIFIVGGAIVGSFVAYFLQEKGFAGKIRAVERDQAIANRRPRCRRPRSGRSSDARSISA